MSLVRAVRCLALMMAACGLLGVAGCERTQPATRAGQALDRAGTATGNAIGGAGQAAGQALERAGTWVKDKTLHQ
jgi:hypothetical protein